MSNEMQEINVPVVSWQSEYLKQLAVMSNELCLALDAISSKIKQQGCQIEYLNSMARIRRKHVDIPLVAPKNG